MKKKWIAGGIVALVILAAIGIRIYTVNKNVQVTEKQFYDLWSVSSLFESRIVILPRESLTRPSP